jgi:hypothetical protein
MKRKKEIVDFCDKCGGPMVTENQQTNLKNDPYAYFLVTTRKVCQWCGRSSIIDNRWV